MSEEESNGSSISLEEVRYEDDADELGDEDDIAGDQIYPTFIISPGARNPMTNKTYTIKERNAAMTAHIESRWEDRRLEDPIPFPFTGRQLHKV